MTAKKRLFIGVAPPASVRESLAAAIESRHHEAGVRWLDPAGWHLALQFLGSVEEDRVDDIRLASAYGVGRVQAFNAEFEGVGAFPSVRRARVIWIGMGKGGDRMAALSTSIQAQTANRGFESEHREFHPHLTVARLRKPRAVTELLESIEFAPVHMDVTEVTLFESHLLPTGAEYDVIDSLPLQN